MEYITAKLYPGAFSDTEVAVLRTISAAQVWNPRAIDLNMEQHRALVSLRHAGYVELATYGYRVKGNQNTVAQQKVEKPMPSAPQSVLAFSVGQRVIWTHERGGWGWVFRTPATVVKVTPKRVVIDADMKDGTTVRRTVKPGKLEPMPGQEAASQPDAVLPAIDFTGAARISVSASSHRAMIVWRDGRKPSEFAEGTPGYAVVVAYGKANGLPQTWRMQGTISYVFGKAS